MSFGEKLQMLRKQRGLSQEMLAEKLNVSRQSVSKWENDDTYPEMDKMISLSQLFDVTLDYLVKENNKEDIVIETDKKYYVTTQKIEDYKRRKVKTGRNIALAVALIISSLSGYFIAEYYQLESIGNFVFLIIVGFAVAFIIFNAIESEKFSELEKKEITMSFNDLECVKEEYLHFKTQFGIGVAGGVCLIIFSVALITLLDDGGFMEMISLVQLFLCVAVAVFGFIYLGVKDSVYRFLVNNKEFIDEKEKENHSLYGLTMPLAAMIYLVLGFTANLWHPGWIVFPVAAILTTGIIAITDEKK